MIDRFWGKYRFLSNFYPAVVILDELEYPTVEHAYQAAKTDNEVSRKAIREAATPGRAKRMSKHATLRPGWNDDVKVAIMINLVTQKFKRKDLAKMLLATGNEELVEGNTWKDTFWGQCPIGNGRNMLGRILMEIRFRL